MDCSQSQQDFSQLMQMPGVRKRAFLGGSPRWRQLQPPLAEMIGMKAGARGGLPGPVGSPAHPSLLQSWVLGGALLGSEDVALQAGWMWLWICVFPLLLSACHWICSSGKKAPGGPKPQPKLLGLYLFIYLFVPWYLVLSSRERSPAHLPGPLSGAKAASWLWGTSVDLALGSPGWGWGRAAQPHSPELPSSLFYTSVYFVCVYSCGGGRCGCIFLRLWSVVSVFSAHPSLPRALPRREGISHQRREIPRNRGGECLPVVDLPEK